MADEMTLKRATYESYKKFWSQIRGPKIVSDFQQTGKITPKEFVEAGDALTMILPNWSWESGDHSKQDYLPPEKKFLKMRGCKCMQRCSAYLDVEGADVDAGDDWVATHSGHEERRAAKEAEERERAAAREKAAAEKAAQKKADAGSDSDENPFYDDDDDDAVKDDDLIGDEEQPKYRLYDVTICYDSYYQSPRVFLAGYSENDHSKPLTADEMYEDVYSENRGKTVTMDPHPYEKAVVISIHPCRHAETLKRIIDGMADRVESAAEGVPEADRVPFVFPAEKALFVFLKFIASVVPTIDYDTAQDLDM